MKQLTLILQSLLVIIGLLRRWSTRNDIRQRFFLDDFIENPNYGTPFATFTGKYLFYVKEVNII